AAKWAAVWSAVDKELARRDDRSWDELKDSYDRLKRAIHVAPPAVLGRAVREAIQRVATRPRLLDVLALLPDHAPRAASLIRLTTSPGALVARAETLGAVTDSVPAAVKAIAAACGPGGAGLVRALLERGERARLIEAHQQLGLADALELRRRPLLIAPRGEV